MKQGLGILLTLSALCGFLAWASAVGASQEAVMPPGYSLLGTGSVRDFDFLAGAWTTTQRRLDKRGVGSTTWNDAPANVHCAIRYMDGVLTAEESFSPAGKVSGLFLYSFDLDKHQWDLYWIDPKGGKIDSPLIGGFNGSHGEFYGEDVEDGRPIKVRYSWVKEDDNHARWEQAYSFDNKSWETNWTTEFTRTDRATHCKKHAGD